MICIPGSKTCFGKTKSREVTAIQRNYDELDWLPILILEKDRLQDRPFVPSLLGWCCTGIPDGTVPSCFSQPSVDNVFGRLLVVTSLFRGFGFRHWAIGSLLSHTFGTLFRSGSDNRVTIYCFSNRN